MESVVETYKNFGVRRERKSLILSFPRPVPTLSWAVLNGGFCMADHIMNHQVSGEDQLFMKDPAQFLESTARDLGVQGKIVGVATSVDLSSLVSMNFRDGGTEVSCFATVGLGNALSVGEPATWFEGNGKPVDTINLILLLTPGLAAEAMVEAIQIATEGRVRALYEAGVPSSRSRLPATGTGTDCIVIVSLGKGDAPYCGKHTRLGELIGLASYEAVKVGIGNAQSY